MKWLLKFIIDTACAYAFCVVFAIPFINIAFLHRRQEDSIRFNGINTQIDSLEEQVNHWRQLENKAQIKIIQLQGDLNGIKKDSTQ